MPIRFRCAYCNQLLGIARRKAGTVVRCPTCSGQVVVPMAETPAPKPREAPAPPVFGRNVFEDIIDMDGSGSHDADSDKPAAPAKAGPPVGSWGTHAEPESNLNSIGASQGGQAGPLPGLYLSHARLTLIAVLGLIALAIAFAAGLLVDRLLF